jgi:hypothetical protein
MLTVFQFPIFFLNTSMVIKNKTCHHFCLQLKHLDPILMLDEFKVKPPAEDAILKLDTVTMTQANLFLKSLRLTTDVNCWQYISEIALTYMLKQFTLGMCCCVSSVTVLSSFLFTVKTP